MLLVIAPVLHIYEPLPPLAVSVVEAPSQRRIGPTGLIDGVLGCVGVIPVVTVTTLQQGVPHFRYQNIFGTILLGGGD